MTATMAPLKPYPAPRNQAGFSLIELMIVVIVVAILASIAVPTYQNQIRDARRADGQGQLLQTAQQLERCYTRFGAYNNGNCQVFLDLAGGIASTEGHYQITAAAGPAPTTFTLQAVPQGAQAGDAECGTLTLDQAGVRGYTGTSPALEECW
jgi:type IV pilus assembly protein PilE